MKTLVLIAALLALQPAFAASLTAHGDTMSDCGKSGGKGTRHGDCPR